MIPMSAALAIPATTLTLKRLLENAIKNSLPSGFPLQVSTGAPPRFDPPRTSAGETSPTEPLGLNLFMHHATPNTGWSPNYEPRRSSSGALLNNGPLVLDLHYLMSAHGATLEREIVLGVGLHALHQSGILQRQQIKALLNPPVPPAPGDPPLDLVETISSEPLWRQFERLTISRETLDTDAMSKIWTALSVPYRPSVGYLVTTVFLEEQLSEFEPITVDVINLMVAQMERAKAKATDLTILALNEQRAAGGLPLLPVAPVVIETLPITKPPEVP
jgi:hypothetical protein